MRARIDKGQSSGSLSTLELSKLRKELNSAYNDEERCWKNKSRNIWLKKDDRNTKYFHACTKDRLARNRLIHIEDEHGVEQRGDTKIGEVDDHYFCDLFRSQLANVSYYASVFYGFVSGVTEDINNNLIREISLQEIKDVVFLLVLTKAMVHMVLHGLFTINFGKKSV